MKNLFLVLTLLATSVTFCQETYSMKYGGRIFNSNGERLNSTKVAENFNQEALKLYNIGRTKKTVGNILFWGGLSTVFIKFLSAANKPIEVNQNGSVKTGQTSNVLFFVGGAMVLTSIPIKIGFQNKIRKSVTIMNEYNSKTDKVSIESTNLMVNSNGIGISLTF
jgi:hypothetical protein